METVTFKIEVAKLRKLFEIFDVNGKSQSEKMRNLCYALLNRNEKSSSSAVLELLEFDVEVLNITIPIFDELVIELNKIWVEREAYFKRLPKNGEGNRPEIEK